MALFGGFQERREKKALEQYLGALSIGSTEIEQLKTACPQAATALHGVLKTTPDRDRRFHALIGLQSLGITPDMVPAILEAVRDDDDMVQEAAAKILRVHRQDPATVVPTLVAAWAEHVSSRPAILEILSEYGRDAHLAAASLVGSLVRPTEALDVARCLDRIGTDGLAEIDRAMVEILNDRRNAAELKALGPAFVSRVEAFLTACVPWRMVDAIPAWRRVLEAYAEVCDRPADALSGVLNELVQYTDWKLRGEVGPQFVEMSRAKKIAARLVAVPLL